MGSPEQESQQNPEISLRSMRSGSVVLPDDIREGLKMALSRLGLNQLELAVRSQTSQSSVSNLFRGRVLGKGGERIVIALEEYAQNRYEGGLLDDESWEEIEGIITDVKRGFHLSKEEQDSLRVNKTEMLNRPSLREKMIRSLASVLRQSVELDQQVSRSMENSDIDQNQVLAALRMSQILNQATRMILSEHGETIFPNKGEMKSLE